MRANTVGLIAGFSSASRRRRQMISVPLRGNTAERLLALLLYASNHHRFSSLVCRSEKAPRSWVLRCVHRERPSC